MRAISVTGERREGGLTLLELLLVITIMALMSVLFPVTFDRVLPSRRAMAAAEEIADGVREVAVSSVERGEAAVLRAATDTGGLVVTWASPNPAPMLKSPGLALVVRGMAESDHIVFSPDGTSSGGAIELTQGKQHLQIQVSALTARVQIVRMGERT